MRLLLRPSATPEHHAHPHAHDQQTPAQSSPTSGACPDARTTSAPAHRHLHDPTGSPHPQPEAPTRCTGTTPRNAACTSTTPSVNPCPASPSASAHDPNGASAPTASNDH